jgi:tetratricopeptide (TPR) repeat protein
MSPTEVQQFLDGLLEQSQYPEAVRLHTDEIIKISEANPLILQWIVSQVDLAQDPLDVFRELQHGEGDAAKRVFDRSFNLSQTTDDGRSVLLALALFPDSASRTGLAFVAGFGHDVQRANDAIMRLAGLRLVGFGERLDRIRIEGLTRELAAAKLAQNDRPSFASRFVEFFSQLAQHFYDTNPVDNDALTVELGNIKVAAGLAYEMHLDDAVYSLASSMAAPVTGLLVTRGQWQEAVHMNQRALEIAKATNVDDAVQFFGHNLGAILVARGQVLTAEGPLKESLRAAERSDDQFHAALTLVELATVSFMKGDTQRARSQYEESLKLASVNTNLPAMGAALHQLGLLAQEAGDLDEARSMFVESLRIKQSQPESVSLARTLIQLGALAEIQGKAAEASGAYGFALQILKRLRSAVAAEAQELLDRTTRQTPPTTGKPS